MAPKSLLKRWLVRSGLFRDQSAERVECCTRAAYPGRKKPMQHSKRERKHQRYHVTGARIGGPNLVALHLQATKLGACPWLAPYLDQTVARLWTHFRAPVLPQFASSNSSSNIDSNNMNTCALHKSTLVAPSPGCCSPAKASTAISSRSSEGSDQPSISLC